MILIGITGGIGHGKSTLADALAQAEPQSLHLEASDIIVEVANALHTQTAEPPNPHDITAVLAWLQPLPAIVASVTHQQMTAIQFTAADIATQPAMYDKLFVHLQMLQRDPQLLHQQIGPGNKLQYRAILQWLGGYLVSKVGSGIWFEEVVRRAEQAAANGIQLCTIGGVRYPSDAAIIHKHNGHVVLIRRPLITEQDVSDPTERERAKIEPDTVVINDGGLQQLAATAVRLLTDIKVGKLAPRYVASDV